MQVGSSGRVLCGERGMPRPSPGTFFSSLPSPARFFRLADRDWRRLVRSTGLLWRREARKGASVATFLSGRGCLGAGSTPPRPCLGPAAAALDAHGMEGRPEPPPSCWTAPGALQPDRQLSFAERSGARALARVSPKGPGLRGLPCFPTGATRSAELRWSCARGRDASASFGPFPAWLTGRGREGASQICWPGERLNSPAFSEPPRSSRPGHRRRRALSFSRSSDSPLLSDINEENLGCPAAREKPVPGDGGGVSRDLAELGPTRVWRAAAFSPSKFAKCPQSRWLSFFNF